MLPLDKVNKPWKEAAALCDHINLYGFWNETTFLTKSGDLGMVLGVPGVDYEIRCGIGERYAKRCLLWSFCDQNSSFRGLKFQELAPRPI